MKRPIILTTTLWMILWGCSKDTPDNVPPVQESEISISLICPVNKAVIPFEADTSLMVLMTDKMSLHEYTVRISNSKDSTLYYKEGHTHAAEFYFTDRFINTALAGEKLDLVVQASNHKGEVLEKKFWFFSEN